MNSPGLGTTLAPLQHARRRGKAKHTFYGMPGSPRVLFGMQPGERNRYLNAWKRTTHQQQEITPCLA